MRRSAPIVAAAAISVTLLVGAPSCGRDEPSNPPAPQEQQPGGDDIPYSADTSTSGDDGGGGLAPGPTLTPLPDTTDDTSGPEPEVQPTNP
jgi:hypothetical protein